ncbi:kinesin-like protein Klp98A [Anabrus simplex]|uniref:kinesin-like protein Klp98A n=1 Tax=Anabrus simplex TaxID=316456 RepID=UPI0035A2D0E1
MASVKVAVRVRPFNQREKDMDAKLIIQMDGKKTRILNSKVTQGKDGDLGRERYKDFTFDHSYWSFDSSDHHYASQEEVFNDLGTEVIQCAFEGYNACVFAYGQTGSGKTFTMMGSPECQGLIPRICKTLFSRMQEGKECGTSYRTEVSYLEIYNERVKDLLRTNASHSLRVREHPRRGPYVQDLSRHLVMDYSDIQELMVRGNNHRTTASTNMNDVSSRSHAIFTIMFVQAAFSNDMPSETESKVHLVDLAGSERADASGATGQRLKEGAHINKSLVTLGSVISALAESSSSHTEGKTTRSVFIPYRDSVLTWLLKDSLGGNSKTIMIAAVSPADCNYGETLSTLRYANRAKNIINKPTINEDPNVKLIRELRDEISKLKALLGNDFTVEMQPQMLAQLQQKEAQEKVLTEEWTEKWRETQKILQEQKALGLRKSGLGVVLDSDMPHLVAIDDDVLSTGVTLYHLKEGETRIGTEEAMTAQDIVLNGIGLEPEHCSITLKGGVATLVPKQQAQCWINTVLVDKPTRLSQGCMILLGRTSMFRYNDPVEAAKLRKEGSRSHLNLSRLSLLSWSTSDLAWSTENLNSSSEDPEREGLEMQRATLLKEKEAFKREQAEREQDWERQQQEKKEALEAAQKELEEERQQMELEYAAQCRRLAEDWQRLEKHQQDSLATLRSREMELKHRRELLELERNEELVQVVSEGKQVAVLRTQLESMRHLFKEYVLGKLGSPCSPIDQIVTEDAGKNATGPSGEESSPESWASLGTDTNVEVIRELANTHRRELAALEAELQNRVKALSHHREKVEKIDLELVDIHTLLQAGAAEFEAMRQSLAQRTQEHLQEIQRRKKSLCLDLKSTSLLETPKSDEDSSSSELFPNQKCAAPTSCTLSSSLGTADTFHTAASPCSEPPDRGMSDSGVDLETMVTIRDKVVRLPSIKKESESDVSCTDDNYSKVVSELLPGRTSGNSTSSFEKVSPPTEIHSSLRRGRWKQQHQHGKRISLIGDRVPNGRRSSTIVPDAVDISITDVMKTMKELCERVNGQKMTIVQSLQNDCDKTKLNNQIAELQELQRQYVRLELALEHRRMSASSEESDDISTSADDGLSEVLGDSLRLDDGDFHDNSPTRRLSINMHQRILQGRLGSPVSPMLYTSNSSQDGEDSFNSSIEGYDCWIRIPTYVLRGAGSSTHYEYEVRVNVAGEKWSLLRRYKRFRELHLTMRDKYGSQVDALTFPPRRFFAKNSESVARQRRKQLELYLRQLLDVCSNIESCPLYSCRQNPTKLALLEFSAFFRKGVFESGKYGTS